MKKVLLIKPLPEEDSDLDANVEFNSIYGPGQVFKTYTPKEAQKYHGEDLAHLNKVSFFIELNTNAADEYGLQRIFGIYHDEISCFKELK